MTTKKVLFFFFFCVYLSKINAFDYEDSCRRWYNDGKNAHYKACKHTISDESLQELDDDLEADNEEIRAWRNCILVEFKYVVNAKIDTKKILDDGQRYFHKLNPVELNTAQTFLNICKAEAEQSDVDIDVIGRFANCALDRAKSLM